jgi:hypothetical protein
MAIPTLADFARRSDFDGRVAKIIEQIEPENEILQDIPWMQCNQGTSHKTTIRTGLPVPTWRLLNYGVQPTKSTTTQVTDTVGMLAAVAQVDAELARINGNTEAWRTSEDSAHLKGMAKEFVDTLFYGNAALDPEKFTGLAPRFNTPSTLNTQSGYNLIDGGAADGQTDCLSMWLIGWGENTVHGIHAAGFPAGWRMKDTPEETLLDAAGGAYRGFRTFYDWNCGISVRDWRYIARAVNIDSSTLTKDYATGPKLPTILVDLTERVASMKGGNFKLYVPRKIHTYLRHQILTKVSSQLTWETVAGQRVMMWDGIPIRRCDSLVNETAIPDASGSFADL